MKDRPKPSIPEIHSRIPSFRSGIRIGNEWKGWWRVRVEDLCVLVFGDFFSFFLVKRNRLHSRILCHVINKTKHTAFLPKHMGLFLKHRAGLPWNSVFISILFSLLRICYNLELLMVAKNGTVLSFIFLSSSSLPPNPLSFIIMLLSLWTFPRAVPGFKCCLLLPSVGGFSLVPVASSFCWHVVVPSPKYSHLSHDLNWGDIIEPLSLSWKGVGSFHLFRTVLRGPLKMWSSGDSGNLAED